MKTKLLFVPALVLIGNFCFAGIIYPSVPDNGRKMVVKYLDPPSRQFLKVSRVEDLAVAKPFGEYCVTNLTNLTPGNFLSSAQRGLWVYQLMMGTNAVGEMALAADKQTGRVFEFGYLKETGSTNTTLEGMRIAEHLPQITNHDYELRRLDIAPILFRSIWLHGESDDILIPLPPTFGRWNAYQPYSERQMLTLLQPEAEKVLKQPKLLR